MTFINVLSQKIFKMNNRINGDHRRDELHIINNAEVKTKVLQISGQNAGKIKLMRTVLKSDHRQLVIQALHSKHPLTLSELSKALKLTKAHVYRNIIILKRIGVVNMKRMGRKAAFMLDYDKLDALKKHNTHLMITNTPS